MAVSSRGDASASYVVQYCERCSFAFTDPVPTEETNAALYEQRDSRQFLEDPPWLARIRGYFARRDARALLAGLPEQPAKILDYGCGGGQHAVALSEVIAGATVCGADYAEEPPSLLGQSSASPQLQYRSFKALDESEERYDLVLARHVLEHVHRPAGTARFLRSRLRPGGIAIVEVPNVLTPVRHLFGRSWEHYYAPYHPLHFTETGLRYTMQQAGFEILHFDFAEIPAVGRSLQNALRRQDYPPWLFALGVLGQPLQVAINRFAHSGTCLRIWARRLD